MKDYLLGANKAIFEKIRLKQIVNLCEILSSSTLLKEEFLRNKFKRFSLNFNETLLFFKEVNLLRVEKGIIMVNDKLKKIFSELDYEHDPEKKIKNFITEIIFQGSNEIRNYIFDFLNNFHLEKNKFLFTPGITQRHRLSGIRNLLMDLEIISYDTERQSYILSEKLNFHLLNKEHEKERKISRDSFLKKKKNEEKLGNAAELEIIRFEENRLKGCPHLVNRIKYVSEENVCAGYDIISFEGGSLRDNTSSISLRYIEVKAVSIEDYKFYWSRNEIEKAKILKNQYYLYLLPVNSTKRFCLENLRIIRNPYLNVYKVKDQWVCELESLSCHAKR